MIGLVSCSSCKESKGTDQSQGLSQEESIELNRSILQQEEEDIALFIERYGWDMEVSGTGLRYWIYEESGSERKPVKGDEIELEYTARLLNGDTVYNSATDGRLKIRVEQDRTPRGLREGVQLMSVGDKARFILPSHLAYGVHGDDKRISYSQVLVYDMELISIAE
jgi:FKBP-type peptidyl-prolyl cis-trans isomerase